MLGSFVLSVRNVICMKCNMHILQSSDYHTSSPKGRAGLRIREWTCSDCGAVHDRDVNADRNILAAGHRRLAAGIPAL